MVRILLLAGERPGAEHLCTVAERFADVNPSIAALRAGALHCRGLVQSDRELLAQAASGFATTPFLPAWAAACEDAGHAAATSGDRSRAVELLDQARDLQAELGAALDVARVNGRLRELGVRRRSRARVTGHSGWQSLTRTEMRVAGLVAEGLSNPEIAKRLFISRHTVESHLKHIFTKLGIGSRVELATIAVRNKNDQTELGARR
jgi:DNA-binding CsgD family transcriptional regulator